MINFEHNAMSLKEAFRITQDESDVFDEIMTNMRLGETTNPPVSWVIQRLWIDERLSDNARAYAIFTVGRFYEYWNFIRGISGRDN